MYLSPASYPLIAHLDLGSVVSELREEIPNIEPILAEKTLSKNYSFGYMTFLPFFTKQSFIIHRFYRSSMLALAPRFLKPLREGDMTLEVDLSSACQAKEEKWSPRDNACICVE